MFDGLRAAFLGWMRVSHQPDPPAGSPDSILIFRAGKNLYKLNLLQWAIAQAAAAIPVLMFFLIFGPFAFSVPIARRAPEWVRILIYTIEGIAFFIYLVQLLLTYVALRLNYEMRWYIVTDRSLRIRTGIWSVKELTMTFANIQQVNLTQGPLERFLGVANLVVTSAGGGGSSGPHGRVSTSHDGRFEGVDNADAIRDLILERLRRYRDAGLGDPDEAHHHHAPADALLAAQEVLSEARLLRTALEPRA